MKRILLIIALIISTVAFAQLPKSLVESTERVSMFDDYDGSLYLSNKYKESSVIDEKSGTFDAKLKYNIYTDALEYKFGSELYTVTKTPTIHARIDDNYFYYCEFKNQRGIKRQGYYILVELNDRYRIYKKYNLEIKDPSQTTMTQLGESGRLKPVVSYYLEERGTIVELPMNKKEFLATFSDKESELGSYIKKERIKVRKEEDLIRLVAKYNALKSIESSPSRSLLTNVGRGN